MASEETGVSITDLRENPRKCIEHIEKCFHLSERTAYDYYTTLLHLHHRDSALKEAVEDATRHAEIKRK
jgi:hypothetical protein